MASKRGRPRKSVEQAKPAASVKSNPPPKPSKAKATSGKGRQKRAQPAEEDELQGEAADTAPASQHGRKPSGGWNKKRSASDAGLGASDDAAAAQPPRKKFAHLKARTRHIAQSVITSKWKPAPLAAQHGARALFLSAKRPVILGRRDDRRRVEAEVTLASVVRRLEKQLPRIPFPPRTKEAAFDLEKVVERNRGLEAQLTPAMHAVELLRGAVEREESAVERERGDLERLEGNARAEERVGRQRARKVHPLLKRGRRAVAASEEAEDAAGSINLASRTETGPRLGLDEEDADRELRPLLGQLRNHLESMQANAAQVEGIDGAMLEAQAALDGLLKRHATTEQYEGLPG